MHSENENNRNLDILLFYIAQAPQEIWQENHDYSNWVKSYQLRNKSEVGTS